MHQSSERCLNCSILHLKQLDRFSKKKKKNNPVDFGVKLTSHFGKLKLILASFNKLSDTYFWVRWYKYNPIRRQSG